jgi:hypothetical protein
MTFAARLARWASTRKMSERSWKPDLLVPVADTAQLELVGPLARGTTAVQGSIKLAALTDDPALCEALDSEVSRLRALGRYASWHLMPAEPPEEGIRLTMNAMRGTFFASNLLLVSDQLPAATLQACRDHGQSIGTGMALLLGGPDGSILRSASSVSVWLSDRSPDWEIGLRVVNTDLPVLLAWLLTHPVDGQVRLNTAVRDPAQRHAARAFLETLVDQGRLPPTTTVHVSTSPFLEALGESPVAELTLLGLPATIELDRLRQIRDAVRGPCLFLQDSGQESLLA